MAHAAWVDGHRSVERKYRNSLAVVIATVIDQHPVPESRDLSFYEGTNYRLRVDRVGQYLVFIYNSGGRYSVENCGNSGLLICDISVPQAVKILSQKYWVSYK